MVGLACARAQVTGPQYSPRRRPSGALPPTGVPPEVAMTRPLSLPLRVFLLTLVCCAALGSATPLLAQRSDRAIISGVVTDPQGGGVPGATVTIRNEETGVSSVLVTNTAGAYTSSPLGLGPYSGTVDLTG